MKSLKKLFNNTGILFLSIGMLLVASCSEDNYLEENAALQENKAECNFDLTEAIAQLNMGNKLILVGKNQSIQAALDKAEPGSYIYIEPGIYEEHLKVKKSGIKLVGIINAAGEEVVLQNPGSYKKAINIEPGVENVAFENIRTRNYVASKTVLGNGNPNNRRRNNPLYTMHREDLGDGIAHYRYDVQMGPGEFDLISIHRVVREHRPYLPVQTKGNLFMVHGAIQDFEDIFLKAGAEVINAETSAPYYLAANHIDVWGIDLGWTKVPADASEFDYMKDWGIERDVTHTLNAMTLSRLIRGFTRQDFGPMNLLGFSYGVFVAYGAASLEALMHPILHNVSGLIPVDNQFKYNNPELVDKACENAAKHLDKLISGVYNNPYGAPLLLFANKAKDAPNGLADAPFNAMGFINQQVMNFIFSDHSAGWHFCGGNYMALNYTDTARITELGINLTAHMPRKLFYDMSACRCEAADISFDDGLSSIAIPILYLTAEGGEGPKGNYTSGLTQSVDISWQNIADPAQPTETNFGHADLWMAKTAREKVWEPLRLWLLKH